MLIPAIFIQYRFEIPSHCNYKKERKKEIKGIQIGKEVKLSLFADYIVPYIENTKDASRKVLELISEFGKVAEHRSLIFIGYND